jgi:hypothetical protein
MHGAIIKVLVDSSIEMGNGYFHHLDWNGIGLTACRVANTIGG